MSEISKSSQSSNSLYRNCLPTQFTRIVENNADRPALIFDIDQQISYRQLDCLSNQVARFLLKRGLQRSDRVCICLEKSSTAYSIILGCIKTGIAYFAIDPASPENRTESIFTQCPPQLIFSESAERLTKWVEKAVLCPCGLPEFCLNLDDSPLQLSGSVALSDPAYIMFTSGSTGNPKGAVITHSNLHYFIDWAINEYQFTPNDRHTHLNPLYFDNSVFDMYSTFFSGGALVPFTSKILQNPFAVVERIERLECSVFFSVPSMLIYLQTTKAIAKGAMGSLRKIIFGGEGYPKTKLAELYEDIGTYATLINVYGPTECTCICSTYTIGPEDFKTLDGYPPIGSLTSPFSYYLLDGDCVVAPGEVGELCLGGPCVGHGYFNEPELTRKAFRQNPLNTSFEERLYYTGDLMRLDPVDGKIWFVGRKDFQIKHQGYRIEPEEIQHGLVKIQDIEEAVVLQVFERGVSKIVGFVASKQTLRPDKLRKDVAQFVPKYMVPSALIVLDRLPKNPNGKTDRKKLLEQYYAEKFQKEPT